MIWTGTGSGGRVPAGGDNVPDLAPLSGRCPGFLGDLRNRRAASERLRRPCRDVCLRSDPCLPQNGVARRSERSQTMGMRCEKNKPTSKASAHGHADDVGACALASAGNYRPRRLRTSKICLSGRSRYPASLHWGRGSESLSPGPCGSSDWHSDRCCDDRRPHIESKRWEESIGSDGGE